MPAVTIASMLWAVYNADRFPEMAARLLSARFAWGTYPIEVKEG